MATLDEIKNLVSLQFGIKNIEENDQIIEDLGAESADVVNLIVTIEDKFQITIKEEELGRIRTVLDLYNHVKTNLKSTD